MVKHSLQILASEEKATSTTIFNNNNEKSSDRLTPFFFSPWSHKTSYFLFWLNYLGHMRAKRGRKMCADKWGPMDVESFAPVTLYSECYMLLWVVLRRIVLAVGSFSEWWGEMSWLLEVSVSDEGKHPDCLRFQWVMRWNVLAVGGFSEWWGEMSWLLDVSVSDAVKCPDCWMFQWVMTWNVLAVGCFSEWWGVSEWWSEMPLQLS